MAIVARLRIVAVACTATIVGSFANVVLTGQSAVVVPPDESHFEVASVRPVGPVASTDATRVAMEAILLKGEFARPHNGRFRTSGVPLHWLIEAAYDVNERQIVGGPSWVRNERYAVDAKAPVSATVAQMRPMLRSLLAERFKLTLRRDTRRLPIYELVAARGGLKIAPMKDGDCVAPENVPPPPRRSTAALFICGGVARRAVSPPPARVDRIEAGGITMSRLVTLFAEEVGRPVVDKTGFTAPFNLALEFTPLSNASFADAPGATIFTAVQEQLGMRLVAAEGPVDVLVIERAERPQ